MRLWTKDANAPVSREELTRRVDAIDEALRAGGDRLPADQVERLRAIRQRLGERTGIAGSRTVVALAGATGSGKSSLFNALAGEPVSRIGARRPTTSVTAAALWGDEPSAELMDWLGVGARHQVPPTAPYADRLAGLVLLDLPDFDSRVAAHRAEADRILELADVFIWVTDPQKYADAVLHDEYIKRMAGHDAVTLVVLNQIDRLSREAVRACVEDLERLLARDGLGKAKVVTTSAVQGTGLDALVREISSVVERRNAAEQRLLADLRQQAGALRQHVGDNEAGFGKGATNELNDALCRAAAVPLVVDAVKRDYRMAAAGKGGWPFTRWVGRLRPRPLNRLGLDRVAGSMSRSDLKMALGRSSLPPASPAAKASVDLATHRLGERVSDGLPGPWAEAVQDAATPGDENLRDALDKAVLGTELRDKTPAWWSVVGALQWLFAIVAIAGLVWLLVLVGFNMAQIHVGVPNLWGWAPVPVVMLVAGVLLGLLLALVSRWLAARGADRRGRKVERRLREAVAEVAQAQVVEPVQQVLDDHRVARERLDEATR
ncbi:ABC transporter [Calidifontibacter sp. DB0510]|uniref:ABC transporter n=1 Tax=Metallococcus carri TaxID=1656884 RepID=A0A967B0K8_9MICO|nr:GTPase [Metallococcus carri]NHN55867.1 ABC transporter [Metallococcus carri]NOP38445.1 ABC transporter [Calidifontibacter sp. DB2511S]